MQKEYNEIGWKADVGGALEQLEHDFSVYQDSKFIKFLKIYHLVLLQRKWRLCEVDRSGEKHPAKEIVRLIHEARKSFKSASEVMYISTSNYFGSECFEGTERQRSADIAEESIEAEHQVVFNTAFPAVNDRESRDKRVGIIKELICKSQLEQVINDAEILDVGCGPCEWTRAFLEFGAHHVTGVDYGGDTLSMARSNLSSEGWGEKFKLVHGSVYDLSFSEEEFDVVSQLGVFHHLDDQDGAVAEVLKVLKPGGTFVYAAAGSGGIRYALQDKIRSIVQSISINELLDILRVMGVAPEQTFHLCDMFKAYYHRESWDELRSRLSSFGLHDFVRMPNELDDPDIYANEKYGDGFMKFHCRYGG